MNEVNKFEIANKEEKKMAVLYNGLWKLLIYKNIKKMDLVKNGKR